MDICGDDRAFEEAYAREFGPNDETTFQSIQRGYQGMTNRLYNNVRRLYDEEQDLLAMINPDLFQPRLFKLRSAGNAQLACCFCQNRALGDSRRIVIFLHTNTSNMLQGLDTLSVCSDLKASLLMYDLRGSGKSDGPGLSNLETHKNDLDVAVSWARCRARGNSVSTAALSALDLADEAPTPPSGSAAAALAMAADAPVEIIIWARGMSTATAIYHASEWTDPIHTPSSSSGSTSGEESTWRLVEPPRRPCDYPVKFIVLDSPYTSIETMVHDGFGRMRSSGWMLPDVLLSVGASMVRSHLSGKLNGMDPFDVRPVDRVEHCFTPACVLIATKDDYVAVDQGIEIASSWLGPVQAKQFVGSHFSPRAPEDLAWVAARARGFLYQNVVTDCS